VSLPFPKRRGAAHRRSKAQETAVAIDDPEIAMAEARDVATALMLGETMSSPASASPMKISSPRHLVMPFQRTRRT
jgi:hypothetical protein